MSEPVRPTAADWDVMAPLIEVARLSNLETIRAFNPDNPIARPAAGAARRAPAEADHLAPAAPKPATSRPRGHYRAKPLTPGSNMHRMREFRALPEAEQIARLYGSVENYRQAMAEAAGE